MDEFELIPQYTTVTFTDVWSSFEEFDEDFVSSPFAGTFTKADSKSFVFYLLYAKYGNNPIANEDINQFKYKIFSVMFMYGPTWEKRLDIQASIRALTEADIIQGSKSISNIASNPSGTPSTSTLEELTYINGQNTTSAKRSKMDAYGELWSLLDTDVTREFIDQFKECFKKFVRPEKPLLFVTETEEEDN